MATLAQIDSVPSALVRARCRIEDTPLASVDGGAARGDAGHVVDVDFLAGIAYVDFGHGAIACYPEELQIVMRQPAKGGE